MCASRGWHGKRDGGLAGSGGHAGRHSTLPRSQKQCWSHPVKFVGMSDQLSKYLPLYSHVPLSTHFIRSGQQLGAIARNVAGSGAQRKQCGSIISNANVDGHSIFAQCNPFLVQMHNDSHPSWNCSPAKFNRRNVSELHSTSATRPNDWPNLYFRFYLFCISCHCARIDVDRRCSNSHSLISRPSMVAVAQQQWLPIARDRPTSHRTIQFDSTNLLDPSPSHIVRMSCDSFSGSVVRIQLYHFRPYTCKSYHNRFRYDPPAATCDRCTCNANRPIRYPYWPWRWWHRSVRWSHHLLLMLAPSVTAKQWKSAIHSIAFLLNQMKIHWNISSINHPRIKIKLTQIVEQCRRSFVVAILLSKTKTKKKTVLKLIDCHERRVSLVILHCEWFGSFGNIKINGFPIAWNIVWCYVCAYSLQLTQCTTIHSRRCISTFASISFCSHLIRLMG